MQDNEAPKADNLLIFSILSLRTAIVWKQKGYIFRIIDNMEKEELSMKRIISVLLAVLCFCLPAFASALSDQDLPEEIREKLDGMTVLSCYVWQGEDPVWMIVVKSQDGMQTLYCFSLTGDTWTESFHTCKVIMQDIGKADVHISEISHDFRNDRTLEGPNLILTQGANDQSDGIFRKVVFQRDEHLVWNLISCFYWDEQFDMDVIGSDVLFYIPKDKADSELVGTVPLFFSKDLREFSPDDIPRTLQQVYDLIRESTQKTKD